MHDDVPLVVSEVNPEALADHHGIVANPNCSTMQMVVALKPLHDAAGIERLVISTYQAVSGTGQAAPSTSSSTSPTRCCTSARSPRPRPTPIRSPSTPCPTPARFAAGDDHTDEERKLINETRKILGDPAIRVSATCVRVPVVTGHSEAVNVQTREQLSPAARARAAAPGARRERARRPRRGAAIRSRSTPPASDEVFVGRIRRDPGHERALDLWIVADNLRKGAALNAVQIAELLHERGPARRRARRPRPAVGTWRSTRSRKESREIARNRGAMISRGAAHARQVPARAVGGAAATPTPSRATSASSARSASPASSPRRPSTGRPSGRDRHGPAQALRLGHQVTLTRRRASSRPAPEPPVEPRAALRPSSRRSSHASPIVEPEPESRSPSHRGAARARAAARGSSPASSVAVAAIRSSPRRPGPRARARARAEHEPEPEIELRQPEPVQAPRAAARHRGRAGGRRGRRPTLEATAVLTAVLDRLGAAHHRPFSRA